MNKPRDDRGKWVRGQHNQASRPEDCTPIKNEMMWQRKCSVTGKHTGARYSQDLKLIASRRLAVLTYRCGTEVASLEKLMLQCLRVYQQMFRFIVRMLDAEMKGRRRKPRLQALRETRKNCQVKIVHEREEKASAFHL